MRTETAAQPRFARCGICGHVYDVTVTPQCPRNHSQEAEASDPQALMEKIKALSPERLDKVAHFVELMGSPGQEAPLARSAAATSEAAFAKILSNFDDVRDSATAPDQEGTRSVAPAPAGANSVAQARSAQELMPYTFRVKRLSFFLLSLCIPLIKVLGAVTLPQEALNFLFVVFIIIWWIVLVGRFHDAGHSGAWSLLMLLPLVNVLVFLYILFTPSAEPRFSPRLLITEYAMDILGG
jgi:uncharacterized protein DUF805